MKDTVENILVDGHRMFYHAKYPAKRLTPVQTLAGSIKIVNVSLLKFGKNLQQWDAGSQDEITRLLNVNWIFQRLSIEPIRKPVLVHREGEEFIVDCGDTRLMSLLEHDTQSTVDIVVTTKTELERYRDWAEIKNDQDLISLSGLDPITSAIFATKETGKDWAVSWLEIGDHTTSHHLHSVDLRISMMQNYLNQQGSNFLFTRDWIKEPIDWAAYQSNF